jgi:hypothetical protein
MNEHVSATDLERLTAHQLESDRIAEVLQHVASCDACQKAVNHGPLYLTYEDEEHLTPEAIADLLGGRADAAEVELIDTHVDDCVECRELLRDARTQAIVPRHWARFAAVAAAVIVAAVAISVWFERDTRSIAPPAIARKPIVPGRPAAWQRLVDDAVTTGRLPLPSVLNDLRPVPRVIRGVDDATPVELAPQGVIVRSTRPMLSWAAFDGATYTVSIQRWGTDEVLTSPVLHEPRWSPGRDLTRGVTYEWQIEVRRDGTSTIVPAPPAPRALFRIVDANEERELSEAEATRGGDHLLLAVLNARAGLVDDALREAETLSRDPHYASLAAQLAKNLRVQR